LNFSIDDSTISGTDGASIPAAPKPTKNRPVNTIHNYSGKNEIGPIKKTEIEIMTMDKLIIIVRLYTVDNQPRSGHPIMKVNAMAANPRPESLVDIP
jgi:hypothetical protein